jgi:hypothetical protein
VFAGSAVRPSFFEDSEVNTLLQNSSSGGSLWRVAQQQAAEARRLQRAASSPKVFGEHKKLRAKMETPAMVLAGVSK